MADNTDFLIQQQRAIERMREMSRKSNGNTPHAMPNVPPFVKLNNPQPKRNPPPPPHEASAPPQKPPVQQPKPQHESTSPLGIDIPILDRIGKEPDMALIIGLLLLLWSEKSDKKLLLALLYILF